MRMEEADQQQALVIRIRFPFTIHLIGDQNPIVLIFDSALILKRLELCHDLATPLISAPDQQTAAFVGIRPLDMLLQRC